MKRLCEKLPTLAVWWTFFNKSPIKSVWSHNRYYSKVVLYTLSLVCVNKKKNQQCRSRIQKYTLKNSTQAATAAAAAIFQV
jgi:hypothetical protein